ncbi:hypothetical protein B0H10DRAFT_1971903 [Mycena sp. CBHHK59/15]|nr:hypothetical protein B0H10DRAFT_1971903 [Mycena sp. CBHHK59/15]
MSWHLRHVTPAIASEPSSTSPHPRRVSELEITDHPISPHIEQHCSAPFRTKLACDPVPKPRSRRCFVCGTMGRHPLDFRVCPCTAVLLRRSLAKFSDDGHFVLFDGSPLPMTRHPGGVAVHILLCLRNPTHVVPEHLDPPPVPHVARIPPQSVTVEPCVPPPCEYNSSSPHAIPPVHRAVPEPEHIPLQRVTPSDLARARASLLTVLLESLLDSVFRAQLHPILSLLDDLHARGPSTFRQRMQPVFEHISLPRL